MIVLRSIGEQEASNLMTQAKANISLTTILPRLSAEAQSWINALSPEYRRSTEHVFNIVGADSFVKNWKTHLEDQMKLENDFA